MKLVILESYVMEPGDLGLVGAAGPGAGRGGVRPHPPMSRSPRGSGDAELVGAEQVPDGRGHPVPVPQPALGGHHRHRHRQPGPGSLPPPRGERGERAGLFHLQRGPDGVQPAADPVPVPRTAGTAPSGTAIGSWISRPGTGILPQVELYGKTFGVCGYGNIGRQTARLAQAFGMRVLVWTRTVRPEYAADGVTFVGLDTLLAESDVVSLHCPATPATRGLIGAEALAKMKPGAILLNTARGALVDENAVAAALESGPSWAGMRPTPLRWSPCRRTALCAKRPTPSLPPMWRGPPAGPSSAFWRSRRTTSPPSSKGKGENIVN